MAQARKILKNMKSVASALPKDMVSLGTSLESSLETEFLVFNPTEFLEHFNVDHAALKLKPSLTHINEEGVAEELLVFRSGKPRRLVLSAKKELCMEQMLMRHVVREGQTTEFFNWARQDTLKKRSPSVRISRRSRTVKLAKVTKAAKRLQRDMVKNEAREKDRPDGEVCGESSSTDEEIAKPRAMQLLEDEEGAKPAKQNAKAKAGTGGCVKLSGHRSRGASAASAVASASLLSCSANTPGVGEEVGGNYVAGAGVGSRSVRSDHNTVKTTGRGGGWQIFIHPMKCRNRSSTLRCLKPAPPWPHLGHGCSQMSCQ